MERTETEKPADRTQLLAEMRPKLKEVALDFAQRLTNETCVGLATRWHMGAKVNEIDNDERAYGEGCVAALALYLNLTPSYLYELAHFAADYSLDEVTGLAGREMANGGHITYSHMMVLTRVRPAKERKETLELVFSESLSVEKLLNYIVSRGFVAVKPARSGRRDMQAGEVSPTPVSVSSDLGDMRKRVGSLVGKIEVWQHRVVRAIAELPPDDISEAWIDQLNQVQADIGKLQKCIAPFLGDLERAIKRAGKVLRLREEAKALKAAAAASGKALDPAELNRLLSATTSSEVPTAPPATRRRALSHVASSSPVTDEGLL